jgi:hypothetical protein
LETLNATVDFERFRPILERAAAARRNPSEVHPVILWKWSSLLPFGEACTRSIIHRRSDTLQKKMTKDTIGIDVSKATLDVFWQLDTSDIPFDRSRPSL